MLLLTVTFKQYLNNEVFRTQYITIYTHTLINIRIHIRIHIYIYIYIYTVKAAYIDMVM